MPEPTDAYADRCEVCGRTDVDDDWLWIEARRFGDEDCEFDTIELAFCTQAHAASHLADVRLDWERVPMEASSGVRADRLMLGCGLLAIALSTVGVVALFRWLL